MAKSKKPTKRPGIFVSVDGPNGAGKSTLLAAIYQHLTSNGYGVHLTKEVTDTTLGKFIRDNHRHYHGKSLAFLLAADRQNHIEQEILPALGSYDVVITDRYVDSSFVFQRLDGVDLNFLWKINRDFLKPDLSILVLAAPDVITARMAQRNTFDRFEESFGREAEIQLFKAAAAFMETKGFNVLTFNNDKASVEDGAKKLSNAIIRLMRRVQIHDES